MQPNLHKFKTYLCSRIMVGMLMVLAGILGLNACEKGPGQPAPGAMPTPQVSVITVETQKVILTTELPGRTAPFRIAEIRPRSAA